MIAIIYTVMATVIVRARRGRKEETEEKEGERLEINGTFKSKNRGDQCTI